MVFIPNVKQINFTPCSEYLSVGGSPSNPHVLSEFQEWVNYCPLQYTLEATLVIWGLVLPFTGHPYLYNQPSSLVQIAGSKSASLSTRWTQAGMPFVLFCALFLWTQFLRARISFG